MVAVLKPNGDTAMCLLAGHFIFSFNSTFDSTGLTPAPTHTHTYKKEIVPAWLTKMLTWTIATT